jgi:signal transduction histidine kinase
VAEQRFELCEVTDQGIGRAYLLPNNRTLHIGRSNNNDIVLPYQGISRQHAKLIPVDGNFLLSDLESHNGTLINGHKIQESRLHAGDSIQFGKLRFLFRLVDAGEDIERLDPEYIDQTTSELLAIEIHRAPRPSSSSLTELAGPALLIRVSQLLTQAKDETSYLYEVLGLLIGATSSSGGRIYLYPSPSEKGYQFRRILTHGDASDLEELTEESFELAEGLIENGSAQKGSRIIQPIHEAKAVAFIFVLWRSRGARLFSMGDLDVAKAVGQLAIFGLARLSLGERLLQLCGELSETQRLAAVGQLAAGLIHEIRNPLGFVSANLQQLGEYTDDLRAVLESQTVSDPKTQSLLHEIIDILQESLSGTQHIASLTRDVLGLTRKDQDYAEPVEFFEVIDSAITILKSEIRRATKIERKFETKEARVKGHRGRLLQVMLNLFANALQALPQERYSQNRLMISVERVSDQLKITLQDNGMGIAKENLSRLFEPFFTTKPAGVGTGLGLAISRDIIANHGGTLTIQSEPQQGTIAIVTLPVLQE